MAQRTVLIDDLDGTEGAETVRFAFNGANYEIDLNSKNVEKMMKALQPFIDKGRKTSAAPKRAAQLGPGAPMPRIDYLSPDNYGKLHRGKVTEQEAKLVRDNQERASKNRQEQTGEPIDFTDASEKKRYGIK